MKTINPVWMCFLCMYTGIGLFSPPVFADIPIAVLEFELNDLTQLPRTPEELERTGSIGSLLREALAKMGGYQLVPIDRDAAEADAAFGYLFDHPDLAAKLGRRFGAEWVAVGRVFKPSFLFAYLRVRLVNVKTQQLAGDYDVRIEGHMKKVAERGAASLADQIDQTIKRSLVEKRTRRSRGPFETGLQLVSSGSDAAGGVTHPTSHRSTLRKDTTFNATLRRVHGCSVR